MVKKIIVDMDGVLCDFIKRFGELVEDAGYEFDINFSKSYDLEKAIIGADDLQTALYLKEQIFMNDDFWLTIPLIDENVIQVLTCLYGAFDLYIVTTPYLPKANCEDLKLQWLNRHFPFIEREKIIFTEKKWEINADCIIEDSAIQIKNFNGVTICVDAPYNQDVETHYRINNWAEIDTLLFRDKILDKDHGDKGVKFSYGKLQWSLVDFEALKPMVEVLMHGAKKYSADNWKNVDPYDYIDAMLRHVTEYSDKIIGRKTKIKEGKKCSSVVDHDSKLKLIGHIMCNALFLAWFEENNKI